MLVHRLDFPHILFCRPRMCHCIRNADQSGMPKVTTVINKPHSLHSLKHSSTKSHCARSRRIVCKFNKGCVQAQKAYWMPLRWMVNKFAHGVHGADSAAFVTKVASFFLDMALPLLQHRQMPQLILYKQIAVASIHLSIFPTMTPQQYY